MRKQYSNENKKKHLNAIAKKIDGSFRFIHLLLATSFFVGGPKRHFDPYRCTDAFKLTSFY